MSEENNSAVTDNQIETSVSEIQELGPEETILDSNPSEGVSDQTNFVEVSEDNISPEVSDIAGAPLEEIVEEIILADTALEPQETTEAPTLEEINGSPQQEFSEAEQLEGAQNISSPEESSTFGSPLQTDTADSIPSQEADVIEIAEIAPEQSELLGQPSQTFSSLAEDSELKLQKLLLNKLFCKGYLRKNKLMLKKVFN